MKPDRPSQPRRSNGKTAARPKNKNSGGRPPKFSESSRPITVTLPESTLHALRQVAPDRGRAIVQLARLAMGSETAAPPLVEVREMATNTGVVVIGPSDALRQIPFLHLVEVAPARYLLALDSGHDFNSLEVAVRDVLHDLPAGPSRERELIEQLLDEVGTARKAKRVRRAEILLVELRQPAIPRKARSR